MTYLLFPLTLASMAAMGMVAWQGTLTPYLSLLVYPYVMVLLPLYDVISRKLQKPADECQTHIIHDAALAIILPLLLMLIGTSVWRLTSLEGTWQMAVSYGLAVGMASGAIGMTAAHELIHRTNPAWRALGIGILVLVQYGHFRIEHIYGHHIHVGTDKDPATARRGEGFYRFFGRVIIDSYTSAWEIETRRLTNKKQMLISRHNRMLHYAALQLACLVIAFGIAGWLGLLFMAVQTVVALLLTEAVGYIQHYGLMRTIDETGKREPIGPHHSWNSRHAAGDWTTFNIGLHSHHHQSARTPYPELSQHPEEHEMPGNYAVMIAMAFVPPVWFAVMDKRLPH